MPEKIGQAIIELGVDASSLQGAFDKEFRSLASRLKSSMPTDSLTPFQQKVSSVLQTVNGGVGKLAGGISGLNTAVGGLLPVLSAGAVIGFGKAFIDAASQVHDLSERLGISITAVQRWQFAASQAGASIDDVAASMGILQKTVAEGGDEAAAKFARIGLSISDLQKMDPQQLFESVAEAIKNIKDPTERAHAALQLLGRGGAKLLPAITEGFREAGDQAEHMGLVMKESTINETEALGDKFDQLLMAGKALIGAVFTPFIPLLSALATVLTYVAGYLSKVIQFVMDAINPFKVWEEIVARVTDGLRAFGLAAQEIPPVTGDAAKSVQAMWDRVQARGEAPTGALKDLDATYAELDKRQQANNETLRKSEEAMKAANKAADDLNAAQRKQLDTLDEIGATTTEVMVHAMEPFIEKLNLARAQGSIPLQQALLNLHEEMMKLRQRAQDAGADVEVFDGILRELQEQAGLTEGALEALMTAVPIRPLAEAFPMIKGYSVDAEIAATKTTMLSDAFKVLGINSQAELQKTAEAAYQAYVVIAQAAAQGNASAKDVKAAFQKWQDAAAEAAGKTKKSFADLFPSVVSTFKDIGKAVDGTFAEMILGAKSFKDGFVDIWKDLKAGVLRILEEMLQYFLNSFLKGLLGALMGQKGAFASAFADLFGGASGGPGGLLSGLLKNILPGGASAAAGAAGGLLPNLAGPGSAIYGGLAQFPGSAAPGAAAGGGPGFFGGSTFGGIATGVAGGMIVGGLVGSKTGSSVAGGFSGLGAGAAAGAWGGPIGAAVGAIAGGLWGWYEAKKAQMAANDARDVEIAKYGPAGTGEGSGFMNLAAKLTAKTGEAGGGHLFQQLLDAHTADKVAEAIEAINAELAKEKTAAEEANDATQKSLEEQKKKYGELKEAAVAKIADIDKEIEHLNASEAPEEHMGTIEKEMRKNLEAQREAAVQEMQKVEEQAAASLDAISEHGKSALDDLKGNLAQFPEDMAGIGREGFARFQESFLGQLHSMDIPTIHIPVETDDLPTPIPMAAGGSGRVTRPTLFLAGESGAEDYAFSGGGKSFSSSAKSKVVSLTVPITIQAMDGASVARVVNSTDFQTALARRLPIMFTDNPEDLRTNTRRSLGVTG